MVEPPAELRGDRLAADELEAPAGHDGVEPGIGGVELGGNGGRFDRGEQAVDDGGLGACGHAGIVAVAPCRTLAAAPQHLCKPGVAR
ncbi:MAG: hypothetical protein QOF97_1379 [Acidimicrobiaceae bacterium]